MSAKTGHEDQAHRSDVLAVGAPRDVRIEHHTHCFGAGQQYPVILIKTNTQFYSD
jgi:hypothetical protein